MEGVYTPSTAQQTIDDLRCELSSLRVHVKTVEDEKVDVETELQIAQGLLVRAFNIIQSFCEDESESDVVESSQLPDDGDELLDDLEQQLQSRKRQLQSLLQSNASQNGPSQGSRGRPTRIPQLWVFTHIVTRQ